MNLLLLFITLSLPAPAQETPREASSFVDIQTVDPTIRVDMRYATAENFTGKIVNGYRTGHCLLTAAAATALAKVQKDLAPQKLSLLMLDCYRPRRAVEEFMQWVRDQSDIKMRAIYYPEEPKATLVKRGYLASKSGHSRGSTVDLTLIRLDSRAPSAFAPRSDCRKTEQLAKTSQLDMGTTHDCFSDLAHTANPNISATAAKNRALLKNAMEKHGFENYSKEWWHFSLKNEPYKTESFDFEVQ